MKFFFCRVCLSSAISCKCPRKAKEHRVENIDSCEETHRSAGAVTQSGFGHAADTGHKALCPVSAALRWSVGVKPHSHSDSSVNSRTHAIMVEHYARI